MKATEGGMAPSTPDATGIKWFGLDPDFRANWAGAKAAGLVRGAYHFGRPDLGNTPEAEADWFLSRVLPGLQPGDLLALDLESGTGNLAAWAARWLARVRARAGFSPLLYASPNFMALHGITYANIGAKYGQWLADWTAHEPGPTNGWPVLAIWQYGSATLSGVGKVDGDLFNGDRATLEKYGKSGLNGAASGSITPPAPKPVPTPTPTPAPVPPVPTNGGSPVASTDPTPAPIVVPVPDVPEPPVVAEQGVTTSEWKLALGFLVQAAAAGTAAAFAHLNMHVDAATLGVIVQLEVAGAFVVASYVISRAIRKFGAK